MFFSLSLAINYQKWPLAPTLKWIQPRNTFKNMEYTPWELIVPFYPVSYILPRVQSRSHMKRKTDQIRKYLQDGNQNGGASELHIRNNWSTWRIFSLEKSNKRYENCFHNFYGNSVIKAISFHRAPPLYNAMKKQHWVNKPQSFITMWNRKWTFSAAFHRIWSSREEHRFWNQSTRLKACCELTLG